MKITIIGTGYVGLVTGACLADVGNDVLCLDVDEKKINMLKSGGIPIFEPGLDVIVKRNVADGRLSFTTDIAESVAFGDIQFIAVGTPPDEDGSADLQYVLKAAENIATYMTSHKIVIDKSTVPVGTADKVRNQIQSVLNQRQENINFSVVSNPEFLKEGAAIEDFMRPDRIVIGVDEQDDFAIKMLRKLYAPFQRNHERLFVMSIRSAELTKYASNAMLATRISFMNELANLSEILGADIEDVRKGMGSDPRIGYHFLYAGCGYGGSCFPKDVQALCKTAEDHGRPLKILNAVETVNELQKSVLFEKITKRFGDDLTGKHFAFWGLSFKPNTDDMREAPSRVLLELLWNAGASVSAFDPVAMDETTRIFGDHPKLQLVHSPTDALKNADALVIVTEWQIFKSPNFTSIQNNLKNPIIFDGRNLYQPNELRNLGFEYYCIGR